MKSRQGFTIVEIMIVVMIIGLLVTMAFPMWQRTRLRAQNETITNNLRQLAAAAQQYFLETGQGSVATVDLVGTEDGKYIKNIEIVRGETYLSPITINDTEFTATSAAGDVSYRQ